MRPLLTLVGKEARDHRAVLLGILGALAFLTGAGFLAFGTRLAAARPPTQALLFLGPGALLVHLGLASELWAAETRRGTLALLQRLPHGLGRALLAKGLYLALAWAAVVLWQALTLGLALELAGEPAAARAHWGALAGPLAPWPAVAALGLGLLPFGLLVSTWLGRSGGAGIGSLVLLVALGLPFYLLLRAHPWSVWLFAADAGDLYRLGGLVALLALLATTVSVLLGHRHAHRPLKPALLGGLTLLLGLLGGYAHARSEIRAYLDFGPNAPDLRVLSAHPGAGGRFLYLTVTRVAPAPPAPGGPGAPRTPTRCWVLDLEHGTRRTLALAGEGGFSPVADAWTHGRMGEGVSLAPPEALVAYEAGAEEIAAVHWLDARTGAVVRTLPWNTRDALTDELTRRALREASWIRDAQGRRLWTREGRVEREGEPWEAPARVRVRDPRAPRLRPSAGGWTSTHFGRTLEVSLLDWDGETRRGALDPFDAWALVLSPEEVLHRRLVRARDADGRPRQHLVVERVRIGEGAAPPQEVKDPPPGWIGVLAPGRVLLLAAAAGTDPGLGVWDPVAGTLAALPVAGAEGGAPTQAVLLGVAADGSRLLRLDEVEGSESRRHCWVQVAADGASARALSPWQPGVPGEAVGFEGDGTLTLLWAGPPARVERRGFGPDGERRVWRLFP